MLQPGRTKAYILPLVAMLACGDRGVPNFVATDARTLPDALVEVDATGDARPPLTDAGSLDAAMSHDASSDAMLGDAGPPDQPPAITLTDVTSLVGLYPGGSEDGDTWGLGSGAAIADLNGDGRPDLVLARCDRANGGPSMFLRQTGAGGFSSFTSSPPFAARFAGRCAHAVGVGDYDNDGDLDVFIGLDGQDVLLDNNGNGVFTDVSATAGIAGPSDDKTTGAIFADVNGDGLLDLYVLAHTPMTMLAGSNPLNANRLYINNGDRTFREAGALSGAAGDGSTQAALISDLDNDGDLDIYVANDKLAIDGFGGAPGLQADAFLERTLLDSYGTPIFADMADTYQLTGPRSSMGLAATDLDGDGRDEVLVTDFGTNHLSVWQPAAGFYADEATAWGLGLAKNPQDEFNVSWGARFVDFDRNGEVELMIGNGYVSPPVNCAGWSQLDHFLRRDGNAFTDITGAVGWPADYACPPAPGTPINSRAIVIGDLDGDGDDDVIVTPWIEPFRFYRNDTSQAGRHRIRVRPRGSVSAPDPVGAVLEVTTLAGTTIRRTLYAGGDTYSQSDRVLEAGLRGDTAVTEAWLHWPSGYSQRLDQTSSFALDTELVVTEPAWLTLSTRVASSSDPAPVLTYRPADAAGNFLGAAGSGRTVNGFRSDGVPLSFVDDGNGNYTAALPHPGSARISFITVVVDGVIQRPNLTVNYKP